MRNMGIVRANPRRWERASSIVWFARFCSFLVSSRVTTSGTIASIVSSTMARMFVLNALSCSALLASTTWASASVAAFFSSSSRCLLAMLCSV